MTGRVFSVSRLTVLATAAALCGCQSPEAFHSSDSGLPTGSGGIFGTGGIVGTGGSGTGGLGTGGGIGTGGSGTGGVGTGGSGTGGAGTGGRATGGTAGTGTGGRGTGGAGGAGTGGRGTGGTAGTGTGGQGTGGAAGAGTGGAGTGTGPCMGLCNNPIVFTTQAYNSGDLGTAATCHETTVNIQGGNCGNFAAGRTFTINGTTTEDCVAGGNWSPPATKRSGGYCFQASAGQASFSYFVTF